MDSVTKRNGTQEQLLNTPENTRDLHKAARCGEPSYIWRAGQERRLKMVLEAAGNQPEGIVLENGCGVGMYIDHLAPFFREVYGLEYDYERAAQAHRQVAKRASNAYILCAAGEYLPFPDKTFNLILSHEVLEHVQDDHLAVKEMVRTLRPGGRIVIFVPNRGYPFETHGVYWRGRYHFGNIPLVNYLPPTMRDRLVPHVRVYSQHDLKLLFDGLPVQYIKRTVIFGAYDNIIARWPYIGKALRATIQRLEGTPLRALGLSHFWVVERI